MFAVKYMLSNKICGRCRLQDPHAEYVRLSEVTKRIPISRLPGQQYRRLKHILTMSTEYCRY